MYPFNSRDVKYKKPFGAASTEEEIEIFFPVHKSTPAKAVFLVVRGESESTRYELKMEKFEGGFYNYRIKFRLNKVGVYWYRFEIDTPEGFYFIGKDSNGKAVRGDWLPEWQLTIYQNGYTTPDWLKGGVIYHIFADRFARISDDRKPRFGCLKSWNEDVTVADDNNDYKADDFFGGNIKGIISKLPYLQSLGVTALYLSPIFEANSNHRYDTGDYMKIDSLFGTEEEFVKLISESGKRGISIILDGVFNHTGADSLYFNKFSHYPSVGAYQSKDSPYYNWYTFNGSKDDYACWWGITVVPSVSRNALGFREFIAGDGGVMEKWTRLGVKGWRLDVVDELATQFVEEIYKKAHGEGDVAVIGEVWEDASTKESYGEKRKYLFGDELDGVMNYPYRSAIINYVLEGNGQEFINTVMTIAENYPLQALNDSMVLVGSHDTIRIINALSGVVPPETRTERRDRRLTKQEFDIGRKRVMLASVLQYMLPGVPTVYYGDEIGMDGWDDPINRRPMPSSGDAALLMHYRKLGEIRRTNRKDFSSDVSMQEWAGVVQIKRGKITAIVNPTSRIFEFEDLQFDLLTRDYVNKVNAYSAIIFK